MQDLERECNLQLARFNWGFVQLQPEEKALLIACHTLPAGDNTHSPADWQAAFGAVMAGLFRAGCRAVAAAALCRLRLNSTMAARCTIDINRIGNET